MSAAEHEHWTQQLPDFYRLDKAAYPARHAQPQTEADLAAQQCPPYAVHNTPNEPEERAE